MLDGYPVVVDLLAETVTSIKRTHPTRVGIDGRSASGKTTLADALGDVIRRTGREVLRASIDDFHRPGHKFRSQRDEWTPRSYYDEGYDYAAFRDLLLRPLGPHGTRRCRTGVFDSYHDVPLAEEWHAVGANCVLVVDGAFLQRPELCAEWDYVIWLDIDEETMVERARQRDVAWVGSEEEVVGRYRRRVGPTHALYEQLVQPRDHVDAVVDMRDLTAPRILRLGQRLG
jgi:uridine kinase